MDTTTLPTPDHCLADFCLIPVSPKVAPPTKHNLTSLPDRDSLSLSLSPSSRRPAPNRAIRREICHALCRNNPRYVTYLSFVYLPVIFYLIPVYHMF